MALSTTGTSLRPIRAAGGQSGTSSAAYTVIPCKASTAFTPGDAIVDDGAGAATVDNTEPSVIIGFCAMKETFTSPATINVDAGTVPDASGNINCVNVALALPGQKFEGTFCDVTNDADHTAAATDLLTGYGLNEHTGTAYLMVDQGEVTAKQVWVESFVSPGFDGLVPTETYYGRQGAIGKENVRVFFYVLADQTVFGT